ncbi:MAG: hypothetical protein M3255_01410 [Pseudomonadota bacterium]|jgi:hypothetical protein|nr:hypothetical protein [Pseudomonadota bacterium]
MNTGDECARWGATGAGFRIECRSFKRVEKNTLKGFVSIKITPPGLVVNDICLHEKQGRRWLSFPAKPYQDKDGKQQWWPIVEIEDREVLRHFQAAGLEAIDRYLQQGGGR